MESSDTERSNQCTDEGVSQASRNRSFKSKQLVRSQAIRETHSPPRTSSPNGVVTGRFTPTQEDVAGDFDNATCDRTIPVAESGDASSHISDKASGVIKNTTNDNDNNVKPQPVEIHITHNTWESECQGQGQAESEQRQRTRRWLGYKRHSDSKDLLSKDPRLICVCGACAVCPHCRGRRQRQRGPTKQDSGIVVSDECPDCSDAETGTNGDGPRKSSSLDVENQYFSCRCSERKDRSKNLSSSRYDSDDKEPIGPELVSFIKDTLNKNGKDRYTLLKLERDFTDFINDTGRCLMRYTLSSTYARMLVHRCAGLFQLSHQVDRLQKNVIVVSKSGTSGGRIPCTGFSEWCTIPFAMSPSHHHGDSVPYAKSILKRDTQSLDESGVSARSASRSKSLEQRERDYERVRRRIFSTDNCNQDENQWQWNGSGPVKVLAPEARKQLLKVQSLESSQGSSQGQSRSVAKSHSFGGYGDHNQQQNRMNGRQGNLSGGNFLSPSSSGYKTLSQRSVDSISTSNGGCSPESMCADNRSVMYAVPDVANVPPGALVLQAQSSQALLNPDGSVYHFDPDNPPVFCDGHLYIMANSKDMIDKRRPRLEKQNSFIDNDCSDVKSDVSEYHQSDDCRNKCSCDCRRNEIKQSCSQSDVPLSQEQKSSTPHSSVNNNYKKMEENNNNGSKATNQNTVASTNPKVPNDHRQVYEEASTKMENSLESSHKQCENENANPIEGKQDVNLNSKIANEPEKVYEKTKSETQRSKDTSQRSTYESTNQRPPSYEPTNQRPPSYEPANQRPQSYDPANHRPPSYDPAYRRHSKLTNQGSLELSQYGQQHNYVHPYRNEEISSPQAIHSHQYMSQEMANIQNLMVQTKLTPMHVADPNLRPVPLANVMYPAPVAPGYQFLGQCRMEPPIQQVYQHVVQQPDEKTTTAHNNESTFRIDPSYPYAPVDYTAPCNACVDPTAATVQQRGYNMPSYAPVEMSSAASGIPVMPSAASYPVMPQPLPYTYQDAVPWQGVQPLVPVAPAKVYMPELCPVIQYPHYNVLYPQMVPQQTAAGSFPYWSTGNLGGARDTPPHAHLAAQAHANTEHNDKGYKGDTEIAAKIQQIKDQMAQSAKDRPGRRQETEVRRPSTGNSILGTCPVPPPPHYANANVARRQLNDDSQLTSTARAIVNSIRNMQPKNNYYSDNRRSDTRTDRMRRDDRTDKDFRTDSRRTINVPLFRPPYLIRQMSPGTWCRRTPAPLHPVLNHPRRPHPDNKNGRR